MAFRKFQTVEDTSVVSKKGHEAIESSIRKMGKTSATELSEEELKKLDSAKHL